MKDALLHISHLGFIPETVIDVGAGEGTLEIYETFPSAYHLLIEPLAEHEDSMKSILEKYEGSYVIAAAHSNSGEIEINVHVDHLDGSSVFKESMGSEVDGVQRTVKAIRIDDILREKNLNGPYLLKADVQGAELSVLDGAIEALKETEAVVLEVSMFEFMINAPQFFDVVVYMKKHGFVVYNFVDKAFRPLDGALAQIDIMFVKENGFFRKDHSFATLKQWKGIARRIKSL